MLIAVADRGVVGDLTRMLTHGDSLNILNLQTYPYTVMHKMPRLSGGAMLSNVYDNISVYSVRKYLHNILQNAE